MQTIVSHKHFNIAKQMGFAPAYWSTIEISNDRQSEPIGVQETKV